VGGQTSITTGTVALLFKPQAIPSIKVTLLQIFRVFRAFRGQKNQIADQWKKSTAFFRLIFLGSAWPLALPALSWETKAFPDMASRDRKT
jgi:hypothetical protein